VRLGPDVGVDAPSPDLPVHPARDWSRWWGILAVSLALMAVALVAFSGSHGASPAHLARGTERHRPAHSPSSTSIPPRSAAPSGRKTATAGDPPTTTTVATSPPVQAGSLPSDAVTPSTAAPTSTIPSTGPAVTPGMQAAEQPVAHEVDIQQGYLQPPDNTSAIYPVTADGSLRVSVQWSGPTTLVLSVTCPDGATKTADGTSTVSVALPVATGSCQATLSEPSTEGETVPYSMTIGPDA
jgi:hypothetical protein